MPTLRAHQTKPQEYTFVLWGERFEESTAAIFVTELRGMGLCAKVVGLTGQRSTGKHGLVLSCDWTLGEALALAQQAICVIAPCSLATLRRLESDPRVLTFFRQAHSNQAQFILNEHNTLEQTGLKELAISPDHVIFYAAHADLAALARHIASALANLATQT